MALGKQRLELEKQKLQFAQSEERLRKLREDREAMTIKAPADGIVYYGKCVRGKWTGTGGEALRRGDPIVPNQVLMTLVQPRPMIVRITVPEAQVEHIRGGEQAVVEPTALPNARLPAIVHQVGGVPLTNGGFDGVLSVALEGRDALMPGMNCDVKFLPYKKLERLDGLAQGRLQRRPRRAQAIRVHRREEGEGQAGEAGSDRGQAEREANRDS